MFPLAALALHLAFAEGYGWFRDELYYLACADHLAWGYVDHPPLSVALLWLVRELLGDSLQAVRLLPAIAGALTVFLGGLIARDLGGGRFAQALAMTSVLVAPVYLALSSFYSMNALDLLFWAAASWLLVRVLGDDRLPTWLLLGVVLGLGLQNKISVLWLGFGLALGLVLARRDVLKRPGPWLAAALALALFAPHVVWQIAEGWPTLEFIRNATGEKMAGLSPLAFLKSQVDNQHPLTLPVWLAGLGYLLLGPGVRQQRPLGILYLAVFALLVVNEKSRAGYLAPAYTVLCGAGGVALERLWRPRRSTLLEVGVIALLLLAGAATAPLGRPILPVERYVAYMGALGLQPSTEEKKEVGALPQFYADMHGWDTLVDEVARAYEALPPADRERAAIFASNYGEAGAVDRLGREHGLPRAISGHNNYWLWGPRGHDGDVMLVLVPSDERLRELFDSVTQVGSIDCDYCMPYQDQRPIWLCRGIRTPLPELWPRLKHYD